MDVHLCVSIKPIENLLRNMDIMLISYFFPLIFYFAILQSLVIPTSNACLELNEPFVVVNGKLTEIISNCILQSIITGL
ncbi:hypothetical protein XELAEV_18037430mg [Xenopus laevis]|uniref:Uncharacterized protein n=1 Tax=Xenopus laevis TaxID=8355 RepID=A0A974CC48_XENLA|nr:hypothetical protein XELAEV_18037430mg [Xenopus laevis]